MDDAGNMQFAPEQPGEAAAEGRWKVLVVDDEPEVLAVTRLALSGMRFDGQPLELIEAGSGKEAVERMRRERDVALILMDVVMETEHAGLDAIRAIREELGIRDTRIVIRTGHPGQAPERHVVVDYDISDYKEKTELTAPKLFATVYTAMRQYREIRALAAARDAIASTAIATRGMLRERDPRRLGALLLEQLQTLYRAAPGNAGRRLSGVVIGGLDSLMPVALAGIGAFAPRVGDALTGPALLARLRALADDSWSTGPDRLEAAFAVGDGARVGLHLRGDGPLVHPDAKLLDILLGNADVAFENSHLLETLEQTQAEVVSMLAEAIEERSLETGQHVRRVAEYCALLGRLAGLPEEEVEVLRLAAPLHDAGKIAIPDAILNKPGCHTPEERGQMRRHAEIGERMFARSRQPVLRAAAIIAGQHHERWDGKGYPRGLAGEQIHIYGRIAALADVFDALASERCYKPAWPMPRIMEAITADRGRAFDPKLVDLLLGHLDEFLAIRARLPD